MAERLLADRGSRLQQKREPKLSVGVVLVEVWEVESTPHRSALSPLGTRKRKCRAVQM